MKKKKKKTNEVGKVQTLPLYVATNATIQHFSDFNSHLISTNAENNIND
jgi:hypothetical protein